MEDTGRATCMQPVTKKYLANTAPDGLWLSSCKLDFLDGVNKNENRT